MIEVVAPLTEVKGIGDEENEDVFQAAIAHKTICVSSAARDEHQPSAKFVFKHPRVFLRASVLRER